MRILITNDDGIHAPGLVACEAIARALSDDVWVVAPETDQSGVSHSLSLNDPLRLRRVGEKRFAVKGTPTDCVIMAVKQVMQERGPDLVLSGVNRGQNIAEDVTYSGTVAGALEATLLGIPAFALSQAYGAATREQPLWACGEHHGPGLIRALLEAGFPKGVLVNINFPDRTPDDVQGVATAVQGRRSADILQVEGRVDGRHNPYYWIGFARARHEPEPGSDIAALAAGKIAVTPLRIDYTDEPTLTRFTTLLQAR